MKDDYVLIVKRALKQLVKLLLCELEAMGSNSGNSLFHKCSGNSLFHKCVG